MTDSFSRTRCHVIIGTPSVMGTHTLDFSLAVNGVSGSSVPREVPITGTYHKDIKRLTIRNLSTRLHPATITDLFRQQPIQPMEEEEEDIAFILQWLKEQGPDEAPADSYLRRRWLEKNEI